MKKISICMATYNGGLYIKEQLESILCQLSPSDEIVISDDGSEDNTVSIINSFNDPRIKLFFNKFRNHILNFEFALGKVSGDYIFLCDQDDVWLSNKIQVMTGYLNENYSMVCSDCYVVDSNLNIISKSFYGNSASRIGFFTNFVHNHYLGCCLAFNKRILNHALPFPKGLITHDTWLGLIAELEGNTIFINDKLIYYRRHATNTSNTTNGSDLSFMSKLSYRLVIIKGLLFNFILKRSRTDVYIQKQSIINHRRYRFFR